MLEVPRWLIAIVAISFATFHAVLGALSWESYTNPSLLWISIAVYLVAVTLTVCLVEGLKMGWPLGLFSFTCAIATALIANAGMRPGLVGTYASWYVGGMGVLLAIAAARSQTIVAWLGSVAITAIVIQSGGVPAIGTAGIVGMVVLVAAGQATSRALSTANNQIETYRAKQTESASALAASEAASEVRKTRLQGVLHRALPALSYIQSSRGRLTAEQKRNAKNLEATLRDEIRGRNLINEEIVKQVAAARARGIEVLLLDEGGLDKSPSEERNEILQKISEAISKVESGKITIRSPKGEKWKVTLVASQSGKTSPDLWLKY